MSKKTTEKLKGELAKTEQPKISGLALTLERQKGEITRALPKGIEVDRFMRIALTAVRTSPDLTEIAQTNPMSIVAACMLSAQLGLEPGPLGQSYLVPYRNKKTGKREAQFQLGYKGILLLARRSGEIASIEARAVNANDYFEHEYGLTPKLIHRPDWDNQSGDPRLFYGVARFANGGQFPLVVTPREIDEHRKRSNADTDNKGPWVTDRRAMELKTVIRIMAPWLPLSAETQTAIMADGAVSVDLGGNMAEDAAASQEFIDLDSEEVEEPAQEAGQAGDAEADDDPGRAF